MDYGSFCDPPQPVILILNLHAIAVCDFRRLILSVVFVSCLINGFSSNTFFEALQIVVRVIAYFRSIYFATGICSCFSHGPVCQIVFAPDRSPQDFVFHLGHFSVITIRIMIAHTGLFVKADICEPFEGVIAILVPDHCSRTSRRLLYRSCYRLAYDEKTRLLKSFSLNEEKVKRARRESGFFANTTHGVDFDAMTAQDHYKLRDEQEKYFSMMKGIMGADRQRNWSELGKEGRLLILFVSQVIGCYMANIRKTKLNKDFHSLQSILDEMRPIRYIEHPNTKPMITPFVGNQVKICEAFGFDIPDDCAPEYVVRKTNKGKRGRPRKNKLVVKEEN